MSDPKNSDERTGHGSQESLSKSLLVRVQAKDDAAWARLVFLYTPVVESWCHRGGLPVADIADTSQDVFQALFRGIDSFRRERQGDTFRGWLYGIVRNKVADYWRKRSDEPQAAGGSTAQLALAQLPEDTVAQLWSRADDPEVSSLYHRALQLLATEFEERTFQAFWRVAVEDQAAATVAAQLGMSTGAVYVAKSRVLKRLREELGDLEDVSIE